MTDTTNMTQQEKITHYAEKLRDGFKAWMDVGIHDKFLKWYEDLPDVTYMQLMNELYKMEYFKTAHGKPDIVIYIYEGFGVSRRPGLDSKYDFDYVIISSDGLISIANRDDIDSMPDCSTEVEVVPPYTDNDGRDLGGFA